MLSVFLPGLGQVLLNRYQRGIIIFFLSIISTDMAFVILPCLMESGLNVIRPVLLAFCAIIYFYNLYDIIWIVLLRERTALKGRKTTLFKNGITAYLRNDFDNARLVFRKILHIDSDDADAIFYLAMAYKSIDNQRKTRQLLNTGYDLDFTRKRQGLESIRDVL